MCSLSRTDRWLYIGEEMWLTSDSSLGSLSKLCALIHSFLIWDGKAVEHEGDELRAPIVVYWKKLI